MIGMIVICLLPIYYLAKSKGYDAALVCVISGLIGWLTPYAMHYLWEYPQLPIVDITIPLVVLGVVWLLPERKGAPGKAYLKITFTCPECHQIIAFGREREGCAELCPKCGEIVTVPLDQFSPKAPTKVKVRPETSEGEVCFEDFARQEDAVQLQAVLESNGVTCRVVNNDGGGVMGQLSAWQDFKVVICAKDWDKAVEIRSGQQITAPLPSVPQAGPLEGAR